MQANTDLKLKAVQPFYRLAHALVFTAGILLTVGFAATLSHADSPALTTATPTTTGSEGGFRLDGGQGDIITPKDMAKGRAEHQLNLDAIAAVRNRNYTVAEADARELESDDNTSYEGEQVMAACFYGEGKTHEALQAYATMAKEGFSNAADVLPYAFLLLKTGQWAKAVSMYNLALRLDGDVQVLRAYTQFSPDNPQPAALEAALHIAVSCDSGWWFYHGTPQQQQDQAVAEMQKALALEPDTAVGHFYYGLSLFEAHHYSQARTEYQKAIDEGDTNIKAIAKVGLQGVP